MKNRAFTLIELIGVVIILALICLLAIPPILNSINSTKGDISALARDLILNANELYLNDNPSEFPIIEGNSYCTTIQDLIDGDYLTSPVLDPITKEEVPTSKFIKSTIIAGTFDYEITDTCEAKSGFVDNSGANAPELLENMIPVIYENDNWVYSDGTQEHWYSYDDKIWANAVVLLPEVTTQYQVGDIIPMDDIALMYVWIPRYTYTIFNGNNEGVPEQIIDIKFERGTTSTGTVSCVDHLNMCSSTVLVDCGDTEEESEGNTGECYEEEFIGCSESSHLVSEICTDASNGSIKNGISTYTHPAFTFSSQKLTGFWAGKFLSSNLGIKPNLYYIKTIGTENFVESALKVSEIYGITNGDNHMMKNMEWGAVAYLKQSKYGLGLEEITVSNTDYAGGGQNDEYKKDFNLSTTGNIYGVYDMSINRSVRVLAETLDWDGSSSFTTMGIDSKYYDVYSYGGEFSGNPAYTIDDHISPHITGKLGDATKETVKIFGNTSGGWYGKSAIFPYYDVDPMYSWFQRGVNGIFSFDGGYPLGMFSSRAVLVKK